MEPTLYIHFGKIAGESMHASKRISDIIAKKKFVIKEDTSKSVAISEIFGFYEEDPTEDVHVLLYSNGLAWFDVFICCEFGFLETSKIVNQQYYAIWKDADILYTTELMEDDVYCGKMDLQAAYHVMKSMHENCNRMQCE